GLGPVSPLRDGVLRSSPRVARHPVRRAHGTARQRGVRGPASATGMSDVRAARSLRSIAFIVGLLLSAPFILGAQDPRLRAQRDTLERIRREREDLERRAAELQSSVHDLDEEVTNLDRRAEATAHLVKVLDNQLASITTELVVASTKVTQSENELA